MTKAEQLHDLIRRAANAAALEDEAERDGNERRRRKAAERWWWRCLQVTYLEQRPDGAMCPQCEWGETGWKVGMLLDDTPIYSCLDHADWLAREAAGRVALEEGDDAGEQ